MTISVGIAGWSYDDWKGIVYPGTCKDTLRFCAEYVDLLEINSTFYRVPEAKQCASWVARTRDLPVVFTAKVPQEFTHAGRSDAGLVAATRAGFAPLAESGKLRMLLMQFSYAFAHGEGALDHLRRLVEAFADVAPLALEVRHKSWELPAGREALQALPVSVVNLDYPGASSGFGPRVTGCNGPQNLAYFRLHGRNRAAWFQKGAGRDQVYDWEYSAPEVAELAQRAVEIARQATQTFVVANNHFHGKAMKLVLELLAFLQARPVAVPRLLAAHYPSLQAIATRGADPFPPARQ